ncbi:uncharacterized protein LOC131250106 [Magnolia sinica]|uniref:uncharacterized protein LOC131250106 n=1 Tax=Magnolia sinica TaxID=86752 RepID=UPI002658A51F|nr:uncharacterized protein LOC131250106 [Magnolia sinica]
MLISDPPTTPRWADVTDDVWQLIRQCLQDKFDLNLTFLYISYVIDDMIKEQFKEYCSELHKRYKRCISHEEDVLSAPPHVTHDDWQILCDRFLSDSFQMRNKINSDNRGKLEVNHVAGSKSFVEIRHDMRDSVTSQEPGPVDLYRGPHCRQTTGSWVHPIAGEIWASMDTLHSQPTPDGTQQSEPEILSEVLGTRSGYVRVLGHDAKLMAPARASSTRSIVVGESATCRADIVEREVQQIRVVVHDIREQLERQMEEQERRMEELARQREEKERRRMKEQAR